MDSPPFLNQLFARSLLGDTGSFEGKSFLASLFQSAREGHLCMPYGEDPPIPSHLWEHGSGLFSQKPVVFHGKNVYLQKNWTIETYLIEQYTRLCQRPSPPFYRPELFEEHLLKETSLFQEQADAMRRAYAEPVSWITGGPGTGKTYTASVWIKLLLQSMDRTQKPHYRIILTAPTGKAALHLQQTLSRYTSLDCSVSVEAMTLHRLLSLRPNEMRLFQTSPVDADLVIVDEASMVDALLFAHLFGSIQTHTHLLFLGDPDQIPSIETGSVFADFAQLSSSSLSHCARTTNQSLRKVAEAIRTKDAPSFFRYSPCQALPCVEDLYHWIAPLISQEPLDPLVSAEYYQKNRVLNALKQGPFGSDRINQQIWEYLMRQCPRGAWWAIPILFLENQEHRGIYNGTLGIQIGKKDLSPSTIYIQNQIIEHPPRFEISFCLSVHKSQGSEFEYVLALFPKGSETFGKEVLYTAATRAKRDWQVHADPETIRTILQGHVRKHSGIVARLSAMREWAKDVERDEKN